MVSECLCLILLFSLTPAWMSPVQEHLGAIQSVPPNVSLVPIRGMLSGPNSITPFITNSLQEALLEEAEKKNRVQRYRDLFTMGQQPIVI